MIGVNECDGVPWWDEYDEYDSGIGVVQGTGMGVIEVRGGLPYFRVRGRIDWGLCIFNLCSSHIFAKFAFLNIILNQLKKSRSWVEVTKNLKKAKFSKVHLAKAVLQDLLLPRKLKRRKHNNCDLLLRIECLVF